MYGKVRGMTYLKPYKHEGLSKKDYNSFQIFEREPTHYKLTFLDFEWG